MIAADRRDGTADSERAALEIAYAAARAAGLGVLPADDERSWVEVWCPCGAELSLRVPGWAPGSAAKTVERFVGEHGHPQR